MFRVVTLLCLFFSGSSFASEPTTGPLHSIEVEEFLKLPEDFRVLYVAGAIDGMTFVSYGNRIEGHDELVKCYRRLPLGGFTEKVVEMAKSKKGFKGNVATLVAMTAGKQCRNSSARRP